MWRNKVKPLTAQEAQTLKRARRQLEAVNSARRRCNEIISAHGAYKSPKLDGMPRGKRLPCGLDGSMDQAEALLLIHEREKKKLAKYRAAAAKIIDRLPPALYGFCMYYYLEGMSVQDAARIMDRSERACWMYKAFIEESIR